MPLTLASSSASGQTLAEALTKQAVDSASSLITAPETSSSKEAARALAAEIIEALGGMAKVQELYNMPTRSTGKIAVVSAISGASNTVDANVLSKGDKLRIELNIMGQPAITGYDGSTSWMKQGDQVFPSDPMTTKRIAEDTEHGNKLLLRFADRDAQMEKVPDKLVNGKVCDGLKFFAGDGKPTIFYADKASHLILRSEYGGLDFEQGVPAVKAVDYFDYRPALGSLLSFRSVEYTDDKKSSETVFGSIEFDPSIGDDAFEIPAIDKIAGLATGAVVIPFEYVSNEIIIKAKINGEKEYRFMVDTGATQNVIEQSVASSMGTRNKGDFALTTGSGFVQMGSINLASVELGGIKLTNVPMAVADLPALSQIHGVKPVGILGANILRRFLVTIDYDRKRVILSDPASVQIPNDAIVIESQPTLGSAGLSVDAKLDNKLSITMLVDTGAAFNSISESLIKPVLKVPLLPVGNVQGVEGKKVLIGAVQLKTINVGGATVADPIFSVAPSSSTDKLPPGLFSGSSLGILGNPFWRNFRLTVDYRNGRLILERPKESQSAETLLHDLEKTEAALVKDKNYDQAIVELGKIAAAAHTEKMDSLEAKALTAETAAYWQKAVSTGKSSDAQSAVSQLNKALSQAHQWDDHEMLAALFAQQAIYLLDAPSRPDDLLTARKLLQTASGYSEMQPAVLVGVSKLLEKIGSLEAAEKTVDQALILAPANWSALVQRYDVAKRRGKAADMNIVAALIDHYWPGVIPPWKAKSNTTTANTMRKAMLKAPNSTAKRKTRS